MEVIISITICFILFYAIYLFWIVFGVKKYTEKNDLEPVKEYPPVSVIIAARNEAKTMKSILEDLDAQTYPKNRYEVIIVDDHSEDATGEILKSIRDFSFSLKIIQLKDAFGKKAAINKGIEEATTGIILTTDADCSVQPEWIKSMVNRFERDQPDLLIGPVKLFPITSWLHVFQDVEFISLQAITMGSAKQDKPILSNGANQMFRRERVEKIADNMGCKYASGDDIFLLQNLKNEKARIQFCFDNKAIVTTRPQKSISDLFSQHLRWFSKSKGYKDKHIILGTIFIGLGNLAILLGLAGVFIFWEGLPYLCGIILIKTIMDYILIQSVQNFYATRIHPLIILLGVLPYSLFSFAVFISAFVVKPKWKGRKI